VAAAPSNVGEVLVRGAVMEGYLDVTTHQVSPPGDWFRTGDLAQWSPGGDLVLKGRIAGSLMTENGHRVYPEEIEAALAGLPGADDVVLVGVAIPGALVARPVACLSGPIGEQSRERIRAVVARALDQNIGREKWPELIHATKAPFPKSANGKVLRGEVSKQLDHHVLIRLAPDSEGAS
jgi:acyl-CoA synthetase (AMP-forming)/AMP-acid ligase II